MYLLFKYIFVRVVVYVVYVVHVVYVVYVVVVVYVVYVINVVFVTAPLHSLGNFFAVCRTYPMLW